MSLEERLESLEKAIVKLTAAMAGKATPSTSTDEEEEETETPPKRGRRAKKGKAKKAAANKAIEAAKQQAHALMKEVAKKKGRGAVVEILEEFKAKVFSDLADEDFEKVAEKAMEVLDEEEEEDDEEDEDPLGD